MKEAVMRDPSNEVGAYPSQYDKPVSATDRQKPSVVYKDGDWDDPTTCHGVEVNYDRDGKLTAFAMDLLQAYYMR